MTERRISAPVLAQLLAKLLGYDLMALAHAANIPRENVIAWLGGKTTAFKTQTLAKLLSLLGVVIDEGRLRLQADRVHFWKLRIAATQKPEDALAPLALLSKLLEGSAITQVTGPAARRGLLRVSEFWMLGGDRVRVVVEIERNRLRKARVTPDLIRGAVWRDDNRTHSMAISASSWKQVLERDMTAREFDDVFNNAVSTVSWGDVALSARQHNLTAKDLCDWIDEKFERDASRRAAAAQGIEVPAAVGKRVIPLTYDVGRRTGTAG